MNKDYFIEKICVLADNAVNPALVYDGYAGIDYVINIKNPLIGEIVTGFEGVIDSSYQVEYFARLGYYARIPLDLSVCHPFALASDLPTYLKDYSTEIWKNYVISRRNKYASALLLSYIYENTTPLSDEGPPPYGYLNAPLTNQLKLDVRIRTSTEIRASILTAIRRYFLDDWKRIYEALFADYDPIENYSMDETTSQEGKETDTISYGMSKTFQPAGTTETETFKRHDKSSVSESVKPFNGNTIRLVKHIVTESEDIPFSQTINPFVKKEIKPNDSKGEETYDGDDTHEKTYTDRKTVVNRSGNIGVTTSQQMIESEIKLRKNHFLDIIYNDMDSIFTVPYWGEIQ